MYKDYAQIDENKISIDSITIDRLDKDTIILYFNDLFEIDNKFYTRNELKQLGIIYILDDYILTPAVEYWLDENEWKYILIYDTDTINWDISNDLIQKIQRKIAEYFCANNQRNCVDCEFNRSTQYNCPLTS